jgi:hypothetical protein
MSLMALLKARPFITLYSISTSVSTLTFVMVAILQVVDSKAGDINIPDELKKLEIQKHEFEQTDQWLNSIVAMDRTVSEGLPAQYEGQSVQVFYGTTRVDTGSTPVNERYGGRETENSKKRLHMGIVKLISLLHTRKGE